MSPEKNPLGFVELCEHLHSELPALSFRMIGEGPLADDVRRRVDRSSLRAVLDYQGYQPNVVTVLRGLDVLVVPSKLDGRPTVIMEANACGTPVLAFRHGSVPEVIDDGVTGHIVASVDEAIHTVGSLLGLDRNRARRRFDERFTTARMARDYVRVYQSLTREARAATGRPIGRNGTVPEAVHY